jgi:Tfp pilus assembly protein PilN
MVEINLLPWRLYAHQKYKKGLYLKTGFSAGFAILMIGIIHLILSHLINNEKLKINDWQQQLVAITSQSQIVKKYNKECEFFRTTLQLMDQSRLNQTNMLSVFHKLISETPDEMVFVTALREGKNLIFTGNSQSMVILTDFLTHFPNAQLLEIKNLSDTTQLQFKFQVVENEKI